MLSCRVRPRRRRVVLVAALAVVGGGLPLVAGAPAYAVEIECSGTNSTEPITDVTVTPPSEAPAPLRTLRIGDVDDYLEEQEPGVAPGAGAVVAVLDSGVSATAPIDTVPVAPFYTRDPDAQPEDLWYHGTAVASLVAGREIGPEIPVGVAPGAQVLDVPVYEGGERAPAVDDLVEGLEYVAGLGGVDIVNVSIAYPPTEALRRAVDAVTRSGKIVVAAAGNRPGEDESYLSDEFAAYRPGEDAAADVFPAGYAPTNKRVVSVSSLPVEGTPFTETLLQNSSISVVAPSAGAVAYSVARGAEPCLLSAPATSFATAEVSGVLALLVARYPRDTPDQTVARLLDTATGGRGNRSVADKTLGRGVVQPLEALTRLVEPARDGSVDRTRPSTGQTRPATLPTPPPDVLASTRNNAVWWGLLGGGALVVALLLRPVLARRRRTS